MDIIKITLAGKNVAWSEIQALFKSIGGLRAMSDTYG